jgi:hypothetical protein
MLGQPHRGARRQITGGVWKRLISGRRSKPADAGRTLSALRLYHLANSEGASLAMASRAVGQIFS